MIDSKFPVNARPSPNFRRVD